MKLKENDAKTFVAVIKQIKKREESKQHDFERDLSSREGKVPCGLTQFDLEMLKENGDFQHYSSGTVLSTEVCFDDFFCHSMK